MLIYACISSHGYGHGSRTASVLAELAALRPDWRFVLSTTLPDAFLQLAFDGVAFERRPQRWDVGMVQADALAVDPSATLAALEQLDRELDSRIATEVAWLQRQGQPLLVLGDVPPPAARIASLMGAPLVWLASFGWDAIYESCGGALARRAQACRELYRQGDLLLRCPLSLPMPWGIPVHDLGLTCSRPRFDPQQLAEALGVPLERERCVLISFGGLGLALDPSLLGRWPDHVFLGSDPALATAPNGRVLPPHVRPLDAMPLVGRLITKPGYSLFCEAFSQGLGIHLVERQGFAEAPVLETALRDHGSHRMLRHDQLLRGDWQLDQPLQSPRLGPLADDGAAVAARALMTLAGS